MIAVIGAGPVGSFAAYKLASNGHDVKVYEAKHAIGKPVQCTGILTGQINRLLKVDDNAIVNYITKARLYAPDGSFAEFKLKDKNIVVDREKFDLSIARLALNTGAKYHYRHKFTQFSKGKAMINGKPIRPEWLIGADGPNSLVAKSAGMFKDRRFIIGNQIKAEMQIEDRNRMDIYLGIGCFSWLVPESNRIGRLGIASYSNLSNKLQILAKKNNVKKILEHQGGIIPLYNPRHSIQKGNVLLVGDAAAQIKATTFGGIVPGFIAARELARNPEDYEKNCKKMLKRDLWLGLKIRQVLDKLNEKDYNKLIAMFQTGKAKEILESNDRDFPSRFLLKLAIAQPRLLKFALKGLCG